MPACSAAGSRRPGDGQGLAGRLEGRGRTWLVAGFTTLWVVGLTLVFTGTLTSRGTGLIDLPQIARYVREWYPILVTSAIGAVGLVLSIVARRDPALGRREAMEDLWLATICGLPLVILVIGVGEAPRNYLAQLAIGAGIAAAGWLWLFEAAVRRLALADDPGRRARSSARSSAWPWPTSSASGSASALIGGLVGGVGRRRARSPLRSGRSPGSRARTRRCANARSPALLTVSLVSATALLAYRSTSARPPRPERRPSTRSWRGYGSNVEPGSTIAFGSYLGFEMGAAAAGRVHAAPGPPRARGRGRRRTRMA